MDGGLMGIVHARVVDERAISDRNKAGQCGVQCTRLDVLAERVSCLQGDEVANAQLVTSATTTEGSTCNVRHDEAKAQLVTSATTTEGSTCNVRHDEAKAQLVTSATTRRRLNL